MIDPLEYGIVRCMASANLDLVRSLYAAWERGDYGSIEWAHPEIELVFADGPSPGSSTGRTQMVEGWRDFLNAWEGFHSEVAEYRELDGERVLVLDHVSARGKSSGVEVGQIGRKGAILFNVRGGKVTRIVLYFNRERAFDDLDLGSEADPAES